MANAMYGKALEKFAKALIDWTAGGTTFKAALVSAAYSPNMSTDEFYSTISANVIGTPVAIANRTATLGVCDSTDASTTFSAVPGPTAAKYIAIYIDTGSAATSSLICLIDTATTLPVTPNGGDIVVTWDNGTYKIFKL